MFGFFLENDMQTPLPSPFLPPLKSDVYSSRTTDFSTTFSVLPNSDGNNFEYVSEDCSEMNKISFANSFSRKKNVDKLFSIIFFKETYKKNASNLRKIKKNVLQGSAPLNRTAH